MGMQEVSRSEALRIRPSEDGGIRPGFVVSKRLESKFTELINNELLPAIKKYIVGKNRQKFLYSEEYKLATADERDALIKRQISKWYQAINNLKLSFYTCYALRELVERERKIREFKAYEYYKVWAKYNIDGIEFVAFYPSVFDATTIKEMEDCLAELHSKKHFVNIYKPDTRAKEPPEPITTAQLQFSGFYLFDFKPQVTLQYADMLYKAGLITNPITNGWYIEDDVIEEMISHLNTLFDNDETLVLQQRRVYEDKKYDRLSQNAIRPTKFLSAYTPKNVHQTPEFQQIDFGEDPKVAKDVLRLYDYIYRFTLATQMREAIYDCSRVEIEVGNRKLKAIANCVVEEYDFDNRKIIRKDGWERIAGELYQKREMAIDSSNEERIVVLPNLTNVSALTPIDIARSQNIKKRPPRFGVGRFIVQVLERNGIGQSYSYDEIIQTLIDSQLVFLDGKMLVPTEAAMATYEWLERYCPDLIDTERMRDFENKWRAVANDEITEASVLQEFTDILLKAQNDAGFVNEDSSPTEAQIRQLERVAKRFNIALPKTAYTSRKEAEKILRENPLPPEVEVGRCPKCNSTVFQKEWINQNTGEVTPYYSCEKRIKDGTGCTFALYDDYVRKYFGDKGLTLYRLEDRINMLKKILSKQMNKDKGFRVDGLIDKNRKPYNAKIWLEPYKDKTSGKERWCFQLRFINTRG